MITIFEPAATAPCRILWHPVACSLRSERKVKLLKTKDFPEKTYVEQRNAQQCCFAGKGRVRRGRCLATTEEATGTGGAEVEDVGDEVSVGS
jgi:hypothetical protein